MAADPVLVDPKHYSVEYENDRVRVVRISYGPREESVMHGHPPCVAVFLSDCDFRFNHPQGKVQDIFAKAGQVLFFEGPFEHLPENVSAKRFEAVLIELKR